MDDNFYVYMDDNFPYIDREKEELFVYVLYQTYLAGYKDATIDSVNSLKNRIIEL